MIIESGKSRIYIEEYNSFYNEYDNNGIVYFFLPSYIDIGELDYSRSPVAIYNETGELLTSPEYNKITEVLMPDDNGEMVRFPIAFYRSSGLYTVELGLHGAELSDIEHGIYIPASIKMITPDGRVEYYEEEACIKGRGNSTWAGEKRPYEIKTDRRIKLFGTKPSDKWVLLANWLDGSCICNKMVFDTAKKIGMEFTIDADWVDLYVDGSYIGNYLLSHEPGLSNEEIDARDLQSINNKYSGHPLDISGGYLIETILTIQKSDFSIPSGCFFKVSSPKNYTSEQLEYISDFTVFIDRILNNGSVDDRYIDFPSFARQLLLDEFFFNVDMGDNSTYFYKKNHQDKLYAGPAWDYDKSCGLTERGSDYMESVTYRGTLDWHGRLMENAAFRQYFERIFDKYHAVFDDLIERDIDAYYDRISDSLAMDGIRWDIEDHYQTKEEIKNFLRKRKNYLSVKYGYKGI